MGATGVRPVKIDEDHQVDINLGMQLLLFLLDNNGSKRPRPLVE